MNESQWKPFIDDKGEGDPPVEYLAAFEEGLRESMDTMSTLWVPDHFDQGRTGVKM